MNITQSIILLSLVLLFNAVSCSQGYGAMIENKTIEGTFKKVRVSSISANIRFLPSPDNKVEIKLSGTKPEGVTLLDINHNSSSIKIKIDRPENEKLNRQCKNLDLKIMLPKKLYQKLDADTVSGDIELKGIDSTKASLQTISGDCDIKNSQSDLNIKTISGDATITLTKDLKFKSVSGNLNLAIDLKQGFSSLKFKTVSGKLKQKLELATYQIEAQQGNFSIKNSVKNKSEIKVETVSGDLAIDKIETAPTHP